MILDINSTLLPYHKYVRDIPMKHHDPKSNAKRHRHDAGRIGAVRKISLVAAAALILAGVGAWVATTTQARVKAPIGAAPIGAKPIDPFQIMMNSTDLPTEEFCQFLFAESCP